MATVVVTIATQQQAFSAGTVPAGIVVTLVGSSVAPVHVAGAPYVASFSDVPVGSYTASAQAVDSLGNLLGSAIVSDAFNVTAPDVMIDVPLSVSVSVQ
jgi:hypothetical protein